MMKGSDIGIQDKKAKLFNEWERFTSTDGESIESYYHRFSKLMNDFKRNKHFPEKIASNLKFLNNFQPEWRPHVTIVHQTKDLHEVDYTQLYDFLKYNLAEVNELRAERLARAHDPLALMENSNNPYNYLVFHQDQPSPVNYMQQPQPNNNFIPQLSFNKNYMQQPMPNPEDITDPTTAINIYRWLEVMVGISLKSTGKNVGNQNGYNALQNVRNQNANQIRNGNVIAARAEGNANGKNEFDLMAAARDLDEIEEVNANCILMANLQQPSTSGTQTDNAPVYVSDGSTEVHNSESCYDNDIFNMFTQDEEYTELLEPIPKLHQVQQNDSNVISVVSSVEQSEGTVDQNPATSKETHALYDSLYNNLAIEVEKVNMSVYQEQYLTKKINALHLSSAKTITTLNKEIANLNNQLSKEKSTVSSLQEEKKKLKSDFKIREDELLDKKIQLENKIKEFDNILVKMGQSIQTMHIHSPKPDSFYHTEQKMVLGYQNLFYLKQAQQKQQCLYNGKVLLEKHDPPAVYDSEETLQLAQEKAKSGEELYFSNTSKTATVSKSISIPNEEFSDDTSPSVARKFLNEVKSTIVTLQRVVKQKMTLDIHNWSSTAHQEIHKIIKDEIFPIVNQVDARLQNFKIQFLKEAAKFVRDFKSLAKEADESLAKHKALEFEIERLLRAVVSQDIMSIVQSNSVVDTSNLQTELDRTKEKLENCIIKKEKEYVVLWNNWYTKCEECKYDKISYDKAYNDMQQKFERLQAQLGDLKGKSKDTPCESDILDPLSQKLENENVELEFQVLNYAKENAHLKTTYKNLFDSINVTRAQTKTITDSLQQKLHDTIYENAKLRA
ncbi:hypothetical protein Tco_0491866 [Tanacetum coccineum]